MDDPDEIPPPTPAKPSQIPSWVMLGFFLGVLFMWLLPDRPAPAKAAPITLEPRAEPNPPAPVRLTDIEAVFAEWGESAVWENDVTEVALWNPTTQAYTDFFEVVRMDKGYYFRSIPRLTRPILARGVKINSPLQFTEPESRRQEWLKEVADENARTMSNTARRIFGPTQPSSPPASNPELPSAARKIEPSGR